MHLIWEFSSRVSSKSIKPTLLDIPILHYIKQNRRTLSRTTINLLTSNNMKYGFCVLIQSRKFTLAHKSIQVPSIYGTLHHPGHNIYGIIAIDITF